MLPELWLTRPLNAVEAEDADSLPFVVAGDLVEDHHRGGSYTCFDKILGPSASQVWTPQVYAGCAHGCWNCQGDAFEATTKPLVDAHLSGYNVALFAYGQSGGGKTYSLLGRVISVS